MHDGLPQHIILSRKGWDSKAGGHPSPILPSGTLLSLPIPDRDSGITYNDVQMADGRSIGPLVESLTRQHIKRTDEVHLDPDLCQHSVVRNRFQAAFGQSGGAQSHLRNRQVLANTAAAANDLFFFFGLYRPVHEDGERWKYTKDKALHLIFGWLQVGQVVELSNAPAPPSCSRHPHAIPSHIVKAELRARQENNNTLYLARPELSFNPDLPGYGVFGPFDITNESDPRRLTKVGQDQTSRWSLPAFFRSLSNMGVKQPQAANGRWEPQRRGPGQEFVLNTFGIEREVKLWLDTMFETAGEKKSSVAAMAGVKS